MTEEKLLYHREYTKEYRKSHPDKILEQKRQYAKTHKDEINRKQRERYSKNREAELERARQRRLTAVPKQKVEKPKKIEKVATFVKPDIPKKGALLKTLGADYLKAAEEERVKYYASKRRVENDQYCKRD